MLISQSVCRRLHCARSPRALQTLPEEVSMPDRSIGPQTRERDGGTLSATVSMPDRSIGLQTRRRNTDLVRADEVSMPDPAIGLQTGAAGRPHPGPSRSFNA